ncbi:Tyrosine-protein kinase receptor Tie-1 [Chionoecetes opilio]|uniref:Tyrosine-protein kinase receptor Tie-1 n=1 Tax=Chionoecetes opilio TaxID=41210 RepID=A0A8J4XQQ5_CHIOP|nr:Tyrosine-protein kinase receptor Tie-1 [Chionoecetes opilio]KAG0712687.1 Tyrosine-protein kinase receptor Tie-1 [Chionoecetes opilio]
MLSGSGFYSFANENNVIDTRILGTFSLQIRDCPAHRYGEDCSDWCPDCLHGGVCHPRSGQCVCQESLMGRRCEVSCKKHMSGRRCTVPIINVPGKQVCRPFPVPCRCSPGFTGPRCNTTCSAGEWGADCALNCRHHCIGNCDSETGDCDVGLPRLRRAPKVTDIGSSTATVLFTRWREGYDDGDEPARGTPYH